MGSSANEVHREPWEWNGCRSRSPTQKLVHVTRPADSPSARRTPLAHPLAADAALDALDRHRGPEVAFGVVTFDVGGQDGGGKHFVETAVDGATAVEALDHEAVVLLAHRTPTRHPAA